MWLDALVDTSVTQSDMFLCRIVWCVVTLVVTISALHRGPLLVFQSFYWGRLLIDILPFSFERIYEHIFLWHCRSRVHCAHSGIFLPALWTILPHGNRREGEALSYISASAEIQGNGEGIMMMSSYGNTFHITGLLRGNQLVIGGFPSPRDSDTELWCFLSC